MAPKKPSLEELAQDVVQWLHRHGETQVEVHLDDKEIVVSKGERSRSLFLGNLHREYSRADPQERPNVLENFLSGLQESDVGFDLDFASARAHLVPVVRDVYSMAHLPLRHGTGATDTQARAVCRPLVGDMVVGLAVDQPHSMLLVPQNLLDGWGHTFEECFEVALENLRAMSTTPRWTEVAPGIWDAAWGDSYESSRMLLPELIAPLKLAHPVAMVPFRDSFFVTSADNPQQVALMARVAAAQTETNARWVSFRLLELQGDDGWVEMQPPPVAAEAFHELELEQLGSAYDAQRKTLEKVFETEGTDLYVASLRLMRRAGEPLASIAIWSSGVDALLPQADLVAVSEMTESGVRAAIVPWAVVQERFGPMLEPTEHVPARWRVRSFPSADAMSQLLRDFPMTAR